jgi:hypothetical protein
VPTFDEKFINMKKIAFLSLVVLFVMASCSKSNKLNKRLDGTWNVVKTGGNALPTGTSYTFKFTKEKDGKGAFEQTYTFSPLPSSTATGTYSLVDDTKIILTLGANQIVDTLTVLEYNKTDLKVTDTDNITWELKKQ